MSEAGDNSRPQPSDAAGGAAVKSVTRNEAGQVIVKLAGRDEPIVDARVVRCFPWSMPESFVSIRDAEGKEVAILSSLDELDADARQVVGEELRDKNFNPKILRVLDFKHEFGVTSIHALTDRGEVSFQIRGRDDIRILSPTRALFRDVDGNTYELADLSALDVAGRKYLQRYF